MILSGYDELRKYLGESGKILFVHGKSLSQFHELDEFHDRVIHFSGYTPNPTLEEAKNASDIDCRYILAVGGGSAIDVAKYAKLNHPAAKLIAIPTTAGSGSEATRFAVIYQDGRKLSITDDNIIPDAVLFDPALLRTLPEYHRKASALDAFSHALESFWSVNANDESREYSREALTAIARILEHYPESYDTEGMQRSAYIAGKAINLSQTTAGHAMCYRITGLFGTAHGHSAAMCNRILFRWLVENTELEALKDIAGAMGCDTPEEASRKFGEIFSHLGLNIPHATEQELDELTKSVNPERLKNFPAVLDEATIRKLYRQILREKE